MRKLSWKLGMLFFAFVLAIEMVLFVSLYATLVHARIEEEFAQLLARGNSHRNVLEKNYDRTTLAHVVMMESLCLQRLARSASSRLYGWKRMPSINSSRPPGRVN